MPKIDTFLKIGHSHEICQDYILSGTDPFPYIILADGCSQAKDSDIGARILCHSALKFLKKNQSRMNILTDHYVGQKIILNALDVKSHFYTNIDCLDATLIMVIKINGIYKIYMFGDGLVYWIDQEDYNSYCQISYKPNAPGYLRYHIDGYEKYKDSHIAQFIKTLNHENVNDDALTPHYFEVHEGDVKYLMLASDGIESFIHKNELLYKSKYLDLVSAIKISKHDLTGMPDCPTYIPDVKELDYLNVSEDMMRFKNMNGVFLKRRVKKVMKNYLKEGFINDDDLSIGCFYEELK